MRKKLHSLVGIGLAVSILGATAIGCGTKTDNKQNAGNAEKPSEIKWAVSIGLLEEDGRADFEKAFQDLTGVKLTIEAPPHNQFYEKLDTAFSSGKAADVMLIGDNNLPKYANTKAVADLTTLAQNSDAVKKIDSKIIDSTKINGKIYGIPVEDGNGTVTYVRQDWLDKLGMQAPKNYEEYYKMLQGFKTMQAPNGSAAIPFTGSTFTAYTYLVDFYQSARPEFVKKDGKWVDGMLQPEMLDALKRLNKAYSDGLIDKEIITNKTSDARDKFIAGRVGAYNYWAGAWGVNLDSRLSAGQAGKDAKAVPIKAIAETKYVNRIPTALAINSKANVEGVFKYFIETALDGGKGSTLFAHGVQGVHYNLDGNKIVPTAMKSKPTEKFAKSYFGRDLYLVDIAGSEAGFDPRLTKSREVFKNDMVMDEQMPVSKTRSRKGGDIQTLREKLIAEAVTGKKTPEAAIEEYKKQMAELEINTILDELNKEH